MVFDYYFLKHIYPPPASPSPASVKLPLRGEKYGNKWFGGFFYDFLPPHPPSPSLASVKVPLKKKKTNDFRDFYETN